MRLCLAGHTTGTPQGVTCIFLNSKFRFQCYPDNPFLSGTRPKGFRHNLRRRRTFNLHFVGISKIKFLTYPRRSGSGVHVFCIFHFLYFELCTVFWFRCCIWQVNIHVVLGSVRFGFLFFSFGYPMQGLKTFRLIERKKTWVLQHVLGQNNLGWFGCSLEWRRPEKRVENVMLVLVQGVAVAGDGRGTESSCSRCTH